MTRSFIVYFHNKHPRLAPFLIEEYSVFNNRINVDKLEEHTLYLVSVDSSANRVVSVDYLTLENMHKGNVSMKTLWNWYYIGFYFVGMTKEETVKTINSPSINQGGSDLTLLIR